MAVKEVETVLLDPFIHLFKRPENVFLYILLSIHLVTWRKESYDLGLLKYFNGFQLVLVPELQ